MRILVKKISNQNDFLISDFSDGVSKYIEAKTYTVIPRPGFVGYYQIEDTNYGFHDIYLNHMIEIERIQIIKDNNDLVDTGEEE